MLIFPKQLQEPFSWRMEAPGQLPGRGTSLALGELSLELSGHSLNGGTWSVTRKRNESSTGGTHLRVGWPFFEWMHLVSYQELEPIQHWGTQLRAEWPFFEWRHLVSF